MALERDLEDVLRVVLTGYGRTWECAGDPSNSFLNTKPHTEEAQGHRRCSAIGRDVCVGGRERYQEDHAIAEMLGSQL